jgi:hypothetical protein
LNKKVSQKSKTDLQKKKFKKNSQKVFFIFLKDTVPSREEKDLLLQAGVDEKKLTIIKTYDADLFKQKLEEAFPPIINCGGFELLKTCGNSKYTLHCQFPQEGIPQNMFVMKDL